MMVPGAFYSKSHVFVKVDCRIKSVYIKLNFRCCWKMSFDVINSLFNKISPYSFSMNRGHGINFLKVKQEIILLFD